VPGLVDLDAIATLAAGPLPIAVMAWAGAPTVARFAAAGAVRVSLGSGIAQAAYALAARAATRAVHRRHLQRDGRGDPVRRHERTRFVRSGLPHRMALGATTLA
jgi:2-methylisocitrate lyase-like PEP mutase family enzyme